MAALCPATRPPRTASTTPPLPHRSPTNPPIFRNPSFCQSCRCLLVRGRIDSWTRRSSRLVHSSRIPRSVADAGPRVLETATPPLEHGQAHILSLLSSVMLCIPRHPRPKSPHVRPPVQSPCHPNHSSNHHATLIILQSMTADAGSITEVASSASRQPMALCPAGSWASSLNAGRWPLSPPDHICAREHD